MTPTTNNHSSHERNTPTPPLGFRIIPRAYLEAGNPLPGDVVAYNIQPELDDYLRRWGPSLFAGKPVADWAQGYCIYATAQPLPCFQSPDQGPERVAPEPTAEQRIAETGDGFKIRVELCQQCHCHVSDWVEAEHFNGRICRPCERIAELERENDASNKALAFIKDRITSNDDFDSDELVKVIEERVGRYSQSVEWFAPKILAEEVAELRAANAQLERERDEARAERDEADRRAGAAERNLAFEKDTTYRRTVWLDEAKKQWGVDRNVSFDVVWEQALALRAQLAASEKDRQWQPIETAPRDGTPILVLERGVVYHVKWGGDRHETWVFFQGIGFVDYATHWMPLPKAPDAAMNEAK